MYRVIYFQITHISVDWLGDFQISDLYSRSKIKLNYNKYTVLNIDRLLVLESILFLVYNSSHFIPWQ